MRAAEGGGFVYWPDKNKKRLAKKKASGGTPNPNPNPNPTHRHPKRPYPHPTHPTPRAFVHVRPPHVCLTLSLPSLRFLEQEGRKLLRERTERARVRQEEGGGMGGAE